MAPVLSKPPPPPPRTPKEVADLAARKARPILDGLLKVVEATLVQGGQTVQDVKHTMGSLGSMVDGLIHNTVRCLETYLCFDLKRYTRGPETKIQGSLPIIFVVMLIMMLYNAFVFAYMPIAGIAINSSTSLLFHAFIFLVLASFVQAVHTDPGGIPKTPEWRTRDVPPEVLRERKQSGSNDFRWCRKSEAYKPDRAHYCRILNRAVLRMDHHCPWLGNTVGFANYKFFYLFLFYANCACGMLGFSVLDLLVHATLPALNTFLLIGAEGLTLLLSVILGPFLVFHTWLLARNMTTIEFCAMMRAKREDDASNAESSMYDIGIFNNICSVLGSNPVAWFFPIGGPPGDGMSFPLRRSVRWSFTSPAASALGVKLDEVDGKEDPEAAHPGLVQVAAKKIGSIKGILLKDEGSKEVDDGCSGFLVWHDAAEFTDDLRVGCEAIEENLEEAAFQLASIASLCGVRVRRSRDSTSRNLLGRRSWRITCNNKGVADDSSSMSSSTFSSSDSESVGSTSVCSGSEKSGRGSD